MVDGSWLMAQGQEGTPAPRLGIQEGARSVRCDAFEFFRKSWENIGNHRNISENYRNIMVFLGFSGFSDILYLLINYWLKFVN